jgi:hypothetical protein
VVVIVAFDPKAHECAFVHRKTREVAAVILRVMKLIVALIAAAAACAGKSASQPKAPEPEAHEALPDLPFEKLDPGQKAQFMKEKVVPAMTPLFQNHDAKKFAQFGCETCHGKGVKDHHFDMPNKELPKLVVKEMMAGTAKLEKRDIEWMAKEIKPTMAKLLGRTEWTPENPKGFGCGQCHPMEE